MKVTGYFLAEESAVKTDTDQDEEEEEVSDDDAQWLDMNEMNMVESGAALFNRSYLAKQRSE